jgi:NarL family two-component system response regulator YdfI
VIHVAVAASSLALRAGLSALLNGSSIQVTAEAATLADLQPLPDGTDVIVLAGGAVALPEIHLDLPQDEPVALLFLVEGSDTPLPLAADLPVRAWGVLPLEASAEELQAAVTALAHGLIVGSPSLVEGDLLRLLGGGNPALHHVSEPVEALTEREAQVLGLLAFGLANKQIAVRLGISEHTVKFHVSAVYVKLGANSRTEAVRLGVRQGLISL